MKQKMDVTIEDTKYAAMLSTRLNKWGEHDASIVMREQTEKKRAKIYIRVFIRCSTVSPSDALCKAYNVLSGMTITGRAPENNGYTKTTYKFTK